MDRGRDHDRLGADLFGGLLFLRLVRQAGQFPQDRHRGRRRDHPRVAGIPDFRRTVYAVPLAHADGGFRGPFLHPLPGLHEAPRPRQRRSHRPLDGHVHGLVESGVRPGTAGLRSAFTPEGIPALHRRGRNHRPRCHHHRKSARAPECGTAAPRSGGAGFRQVGLRRIPRFGPHRVHRGGRRVHRRLPSADSGALPGRKSAPRPPGRI